MARRHGLRISGWLPRGGLGFVGFAPLTAALLCTAWADAGFALLVTAGNLFACMWCAAGLRRDDANDEAADSYTARTRGVRLIDIFSGEFESERMWSSDMILASLAALVFGILRYLMGWGPIA